jgi:hypothetical protein
MECSRRGVDKAIRDLRFSIEKNARTLLDGSVRYDGNGDAKPKATAAEQKAIAEVLSDMDAEVKALVKRRDKTVLIKSGMLQNLLTGRVRL